MPVPEYIKRAGTRPRHVTKFMTPQTRPLNNHEIATWNPTIYGRFIVAAEVFGANRGWPGLPH